MLRDEVVDHARAPRDFRLYRQRRPFTVDRTPYRVEVDISLHSIFASLICDGREIANARVPTYGRGSTQNLWLIARTSSGALMEIEVGYVNSFSFGIAVSLDETLIYKSHPRKTLRYPPYMAGIAERMGGEYGSSNLDLGAYARNKVPLLVDVVFGVGFYILAQLTDLSTAAVSMALTGLLVWLVQRLSGVDLLGGLASFGVIISVISAALAYIFQSDAAIKFAPSITHLIVGLSFAIDGLRGGSWLGRGLARYLPYRHVDVRRLAWGMGLLSLTSASLNTAVANLAPTQVWLFYTTFVDLPVLLLAGFFLLEWIQSGNAIEQ